MAQQFETVCRYLNIAGDPEHSGERYGNALVAVKTELINVWYCAGSDPESAEFRLTAN